MYKVNTIMTKGKLLYHDYIKLWRAGKMVIKSRRHKDGFYEQIFTILSKNLEQNS
jgi:hypothetical protein